MYLDLEGIAFVFLALAVGAVGVALLPHLTVGGRNASSVAVIILALIAAILALID